MAWRSGISLLILLTLFLTVSLSAKEEELSPKRGIERYKKLVRLHPRKASYQNALGYYHLKAGHLGEAKCHFQKAIHLDGNYATAYNNLGIVHLRQGEPEQAEKQFHQAVRLNPRYSKAQYNLAVALFRQKKYAKSAKAYFKARELDSEYVERRDNLEKMKQALEQATEGDKSTEQLKRMKQWFAPSY